MTVLSVCQQVSSYIGIARPVAVVGSTRREHLELGDIANECGRQLAECHPWQKLKVLATFTGDGDTTAFDLPDDYGWMPEGSYVRTSPGNIEVCNVTDDDQWLQGQIYGGTVSYGGLWRLIGGQMVFNPAPIADDQRKFYYQSNGWAENSDGDPQEGFTADSDTFRLSEEMLRKCIVWKWRVYKGLPADMEFAVFTEDLAKRVMRDKGPRGFAVGRTGPALYGGAGSSTADNDVFPFTLPFELNP